MNQKQNGLETKLIRNRADKKQNGSETERIRNKMDQKQLMDQKQNKSETK